MPKFKVHVSQMVERLITLEVEADTVTAARRKAEVVAASGMCSGWEEGDNADDPYVYSVDDEKGDLVWEEADGENDED